MTKQKTALKLRIYLAGIKPTISRRVIVSPELTLEQMSHVIQCVMPWSGGHLHQFLKKGERYLCPFPEATEEDMPDIDAYMKLTIGDLISSEGDFVKYEYDFSDSWIHNITVEKVLPPLEDRLAVYVSGKNMAPPEDCGSIQGFEHLKKVMSDKNHPEYAEMAEWLLMEEDDEFDPSYIGCDSDDIDDMLFETLEGEWAEDE